MRLPCNVSLITHRKVIGELTVRAMKNVWECISIRCCECGSYSSVLIYLGWIKGGGLGMGVRGDIR